jgi:hypothetical protein
MSDLYKLVNRQPVRCRDLLEWGRWMETADRRVAHSNLAGGVNVSTVFLGLDHNFSGGTPLLFETMVFGGEYNHYQERCSTWEQAEQQHARAVFMVADRLHKSISPLGK